MQWPRLSVRLRVRTLMFVVVLVAGGLGWIVHEARLQRDAVRAIELAGGTVQYDTDWSGATLPAGTVAKGLSWKPKWLIDLIGTDYLLNVVRVDLPQGTANSEALLVHIGHLKRLETLTVRSRNLVTDARLIHLKALTKLSNLQLLGSRVTAEGLVHLKDLTNLRTLILWQSRVDDAGVAHLRRLTDLRTLDLSTTRVSDLGLLSLEGLTNLEGLSLSGTQVSDSGLMHLRHMTRLRVLLLNGTWVTDAGLVHLQALKQLRLLHLDRRQISDAGVVELQRALPNTKIIRK